MSVSHKISRIFFYLLLGLVVTPCLAQQKNTTIVKVFRIQYADPTAISTAVQAMLSDEGSITVQPARKRLTVSDRPERVSRIAGVVARMDVQPENFRITVVLLRGDASLKKDEAPYSMPARLQKMFPFKVYSELGEAELQGTIGDTVKMNLGEQYRLSMTVLKPRPENFAFGFAVSSLRFDLQPVILQEVRKSRPPHKILKTRVLLSENQEVSIGAGASEDAHEGLVLVLKALPTEAR